MDHVLCVLIQSVCLFSRPVLLREITLEGTINTTGSTGTVFIYITQTGTEDITYSSGHGGIEWKKSGGKTESC